MKYDAKEFKQYPEIMNKEQMRIACHISKRTALYLLQFDLIPHTCTGKKTRCYSIKKSDVIAFMLNISRHLAYSLINDGYIPGIKIGNAYRVPKVNVINYALSAGNSGPAA